jgi:hypothetical protein
MRRKRAYAPVAIFAVLAAVLVAVAAARVWLGLRDDLSSAADASSQERASSAEPVLFRRPDIPFTFEYPAYFAPADPPSGILWVAGISPVDIVDVRRVAEREFSTQGMTTVYGATLRQQEGVEILGSETRATNAGVVVIFEVGTGSTVPLRSQLIYVALAGSIWQLECQSQAGHQREIEDACELMLHTLAPR